MNSRFKFRVWDKGNEQYLNLSEVDYLTLNTENGGLIIGFLDELMTEMTYMPEKDMVVEQCTGLKDKNGNLIYEGDIVKDKFDNTYLIKWFNAKFICEDQAEMQPIFSPSQELLLNWGVKIISNIHEQAEQKD